MGSPAAGQQPRITVRFPGRYELQALKRQPQLARFHPKWPGSAPDFAERADREEPAGGKPLDNGPVQTPVAKPVAEKHIH